MPSEPIRLDNQDLYSADVEAFLDERDALRRLTPEAEPTPLFQRVVYSGWFYLAVFGILGALIGWAAIEPFFSDTALLELQFREGMGQPIDPVELWPVFLLFPTVAAGIGLSLGIAEGLMSRNFTRALITAAVGAAVGFVGALILMIPANLAMNLMGEMAMEVGNDNDPLRRFPEGIGLMVAILGRGMAWAILAIPAGLGQGIALRSGRMMLNGFLGALFGGFIGGMLFDPIDILVNGPRFPPGFDPGNPATFELLGNASLERAVGFCCIGLFVGLFIGLVEGWTKTAWLMMRKGPLAGKQFVLYKNPTVLGSSPKADVYLFKDDAIEPRHALIHNRGGRFEIEDLDTRDGTYVNGIPVRRQMLQAGDQIVLGKTVFEFAVKDSG